MIHCIANEKSNLGNIRETFFLNQIRVRNEVFDSAVADFQIGENTFEVGGKSKGIRQIKGIQNGFIVKDDIEYGQFNTIPLWHFGLTY